MLRAALVLAATLPCLAGCALYVPAVAYAPLPERAGEVRVHAGIGAQGVAGVASYSPFSGALVFAGGEREWATDDTLRTRSRRVLGGGVGAYSGVGRVGVVELLAGYDAGRVSTTENARPLFGGPDRVFWVRHGSMGRTFAQLDLGVRGRLREEEAISAAAAVSFRVSSVRFTDLSQIRDGEPQPGPTEERVMVYEPGLVVSFTVGLVRFETSTRLALPADVPDVISLQPMRSDLGVSVAIDRLFRRD